MKAPLKVKTLHKAYKFEKPPSFKDWVVYPNELPDIREAMDNYAKAYAKVAMNEILATWNRDGLCIEISEEDDASIDISYKDFLNALVESAHEHEKYHGDYDPFQCSLNNLIWELEEALKHLKSFKKVNEV